MQTNYLATSPQWREAWQRNWSSVELKRVRISVAYCSKNGAQELERAWQMQNVPVELLVGLNDGVTDAAAQLALFEWMQSSSAVEVRSYFQRGGRFHPKVYAFEFETEVRVLVGSFNLTQSAFYQNTEAAFELILTDQESPHHEMSVSLGQWWKQASPLVHPDDFGAQTRRNGPEWVLVQLMRRGLFVSVEASLRELYVPFSGDLFDLGNDKRFVSETLLVERNRRAQVFLLSKATRNRIEKLQERARQNCNALAFSCTGGRFVPQTAFGMWQSAHEKIQGEFDALVLELMMPERQRVERGALEQKVRKDAERIWREFHDQAIPKNKQEETVRQSLAAFDKCAPRFNEVVQLRYTLRFNHFPDLWAQIGDGEVQGVESEKRFVEHVDEVIDLKNVVQTQVQQTRETTIKEWMRALYVTPRSLAAVSLNQLLNQRKTGKSRETVYRELVEKLNFFNFYGDSCLSELQVFLGQNEWQLVSGKPQTPSLFAAEDQLQEFHQQMNGDLKAAQEWPHMELQKVLKDFVSRVGWN